MSVVVIGVNHRTVPLDVLERLTVDPADRAKALADLASRTNVSEAILLSTCNRVEVYVRAEKFHGAYEDVRNFFAEFGHVAPEDFADHVFSFHDQEAVRHLFEVASGLDSAVLGETEIQRQVKDAWEAAHAEGTVGTGLNELFRSALEVGKRARTETGIARNITSVSQAAVAMATERLGTLDGQRILVLGAGEMASGMLATLGSLNDAEIVVANRTRTRAEAVAEQCGGRIVDLVDLPSELREADLLLTSTGAQSLMLEAGALESIMRFRSGRELLIVDIAVPRDVDPSAAEIDGVTLLDMGDLSDFAEAGIRERRGEIALVEQIIDEDVHRYADLASAREVAPLVTEFRQNAEAIRQGEMERFEAKLATMTADQREAVEALTKGLVAKMAHEPTVRIKDAAGSPRGTRLADALRELFNL